LVEDVSQIEGRFLEFFRTATHDDSSPEGHKPYPFQTRLATAKELPELIDIPTGLGKTDAVVLAWLWRRRFAGEETRAATPRRLVYCLPMRTLVEQTRDKAKMWLKNLGLLSEKSGDSNPADTSKWKRTEKTDQDKTRIAVTVLMGGEDRDEWDLYPERDAIIIGTQDMLLSRALNRGYGMSRYRWPVHFGLLNNDCLWVMDEVQLMGNGLATSVQLQLFQDKFWRPAISNHFLWMSATPAKGMFCTRDRSDHEMVEIPEGRILSLLKEKTQDIPSLKAIKKVVGCESEPKISKILNRHYAQSGNFTLMVLNTVKNAQNLFSDIKNAVYCQSESEKKATKVILLHGRMRPCDRKSLMDQISDFDKKQKEKKQEASGLIVVATQVIEAGLDVSADYLWSEIAPWSSVIQRLGRLNRRGKQDNACSWFWMPKADVKNDNAKDSPNEGRVGPYEKKDLDAAQHLLNELGEKIQTIGDYRNALDDVLKTDESEKAREISHDIVIRPPDLHDLFSTEPDLVGGFTDISRYIRDADQDADVQVFWADFKDRPANEHSVKMDSLCRVPVFTLRAFLKSNRTSAWEWDPEIRAYQKVRPEMLCPGMTLLLAKNTGGYSKDLGWTGNKNDQPTDGFAEPVTPEAFSDDTESASAWLKLDDHLRDARAEALGLVESLALANVFKDSVVTAASWHDVGKAHPRWQGEIRAYNDRIQFKVKERAPSLFQEIKPSLDPAENLNSLQAKFPNWDKLIESFLKKRGNYTESLIGQLKSRFDPRLRHEAASSLAAWKYWLERSENMTALSLYLIAAHHGKVRTVLRSRGKDRNDVFGINPDDKLKPIPGWINKEIILDLSPKYFGLPGKWLDDGDYESCMPSWISVVSEILGKSHPGDVDILGSIPDGETKNIGPFALAFLESLVIAADRRASSKPGKGGNL